MAGLYEIGLIATLESKLEDALTENARLGEELRKAQAHITYAHTQLDLFERQRPTVYIEQVRRWLGSRL